MIENRELHIEQLKNEIDEYINEKARMIHSGQDVNGIDYLIEVLRGKLRNVNERFNKD